MGSLIGPLIDELAWYGRVFIWVAVMFVALAFGLGLLIGRLG